jgi:hypothetical protein
MDRKKESARAADPTTAKTLVGAGIGLALLASAGGARGDIKAAQVQAQRPDADHVPTPAAPAHRAFGLTMDVGVPDGAAVGVVVRPKFDWVRLGASATHNGIAPGVRLGVTIDPVDYPLAPTLTVEGGHYWEGKLPTLKDSPSIGYNYANFHVGLEVGSRASFRFFLRGGASWVDVTAASQTQGSMTGGTVSGIGNPSYSGWLAPSGKLGFSAFF